jgi:hypothetical protein
MMRGFNGKTTALYEASQLQKLLSLSAVRYF